MVLSRGGRLATERNYRTVFLLATIVCTALLFFLLIGPILHKLRSNSFFTRLDMKAPLVYLS